MGQKCSCERKGHEQFEEAHLATDNQNPIMFSMAPQTQSMPPNNMGAFDPASARLAASDYYIPRNGSIILDSQSRVNQKMRVLASDNQFNEIQQKSAYELKEGGEYEGETKDGVPHGKGKEISPAGDEYVGNFVMGKKHGFGVYYKRDAYSYRGNFQHNKINGFGKIEYMDGTSYEGYFKNGVFNGEGTLYDKAGDPQKGMWNNGVVIPSQ